METVILSGFDVRLTDSGSAYEVRASWKRSSTGHAVELRWFARSSESARELRQRLWEAGLMAETEHELLDRVRAPASRVVTSARPPSRTQ